MIEKCELEKGRYVIEGDRRSKKIWCCEFHKKKYEDGIEASCQKKIDKFLEENKAWIRKKDLEWIYKD